MGEELDQLLCSISVRGQQDRELGRKFTLVGTKGKLEPTLFPVSSILSQEVKNQQRTKGAEDERSCPSSQDMARWTHVSCFSVSLSWLSDINRAV